MHQPFGRAECKSSEARYGDHEAGCSSLAISKTGLCHKEVLLGYLFLCFDRIFWLRNIQLRCAKPIKLLSGVLAQDVKGLF